MTTTVAIQSLVLSDVARFRGLLLHLGTKLQQLHCGMRAGGHFEMKHFEQDRISLRCAWCGHETPGWEINQPYWPRRNR